jgi:acyl-CoA thioesterase FadM
MRRQGYLIVATEINVKYLAPAYPGETLEIVTWVREVRGARSFWVQEIREAESQRLTVTAQVTGAFMNDGGRPIRVPSAVAEKLSALQVPPHERPRSV